ncbi:MAG: hypothetical protein M0Q21_08370 [Ignavibacteriaceae bacterium]|nr:hypothetical protein [Ignavibacteriaceae bacterium]
MENKIKVLIVGGCFPVQENITPEDLYHQILKKKLNEYIGVNLEIKIIRYDLIPQCYEAIVEAIDLDKPDWILFHLRVEPLLGLAKLYYKYHDKNKTRTTCITASSINFKYKKNHPTGKELKDKESSGGSLNSQSLVRYILREMNYFLGKIVGNMTSAFAIYLDLLQQIITLCKNSNIELIITGPVSRPHTFYEDYFSRKLHLFINSFISGKGMIYLNCLGRSDQNGESLFFDDQIMVNERGHKRIAELIYTAICEQNLSIRTMVVRDETCPGSKGTHKLL